MAVLGFIDHTYTHPCRVSMGGLAGRNPVARFIAEWVEQASVDVDTSLAGGDGDSGLGLEKGT